MTGKYVDGSGCDVLDVKIKTKTRSTYILLMSSNFKPTKSSNNYKIKKISYYQITKKVTDKVMIYFASVIQRFLVPHYERFVWSQTI
jgi:hypothetical protein